VNGSGYLNRTIDDRRVNQSNNDCTCGRNGNAYGIGDGNGNAYAYGLCNGDHHEDGSEEAGHQ
jgi:hypothetical protein